MRLTLKQHWEEPKTNSFIYGLIDPIDGTLRYIGQTTIGIDRIKAHIYGSKYKLKFNKHKYNWIKKLVKRNLLFDVIYLEYCLKNELNEAETFWIQYFKGLGCKLYNRNDGGDAINHPKMSEERLLQHRNTMKEVMNRPEVRQKLSDSHKGQVAWNKGKTYGPETKTKISISQTRKIKVIDSVGNEYTSLLDASKKVGCTPTDIRRCILNPNKTIKGISFKKLLCLSTI